MAIFNSQRKQTTRGNTGKFTAALEIGCKLLAATRIEQQLKVGGHGW